MTELSNWGKWGKDDQAGTIHLITPAKRKAAAALVREGVSVSMRSMPISPRKGRPADRCPAWAVPAARGRECGDRATWTLTSRPPGPEPRDVAAYVVDTIAVSYHGNNTTHLDAPSHLYYKGQIYNGYSQSSYSDRGAGKDDVMWMKDGVLTRGILFDIPKLKGVSYLGDDERFMWKTWRPGRKRPASAWNRAMLSWCARGAGCGCARKGPLDLNRATPGLYASCLKWLRERGAAMLGSDVVQDVRPSHMAGVNQPIHQIGLKPWECP